MTLVSLDLYQKKLWLEGHPQAPGSPGVQVLEPQRVRGAEVQVEGRRGSNRDLQRSHQGGLILTPHQVLRGRRFASSQILWINATGMQKGIQAVPEGTDLSRHCYQP